MNQKTEDRGQRTEALARLCRVLESECRVAGHNDLASVLCLSSSVKSDSRTVRAGDTFIAYPGSLADGRQFIGQAIANGANAVIWDTHNFDWDDAWQVPNLGVANLRQHAGEIADYVYRSPSTQLWTVGITGTNGKTSCTHWAAQSLAKLGRKTALIGTLGNGFPGALSPTLNTTPDAIQVHGLLADYLAQGAQAVAMEVSSHALQQGRVSGVHFDVAMLTNLSRDHLDYHGDMRSYAAAKQKLFEWPHLKYAVINLDDMFGAELAEQLQDHETETIGYGLSEAALQRAERLGLRMVYGHALHMNVAGLSMQVHTSWGGGELHSELLGRFNAANLLGVLAVLLVSGVTLADALRNLSQASAVPGRMQTIRLSENQASGGAKHPMVVVDYAHTPDALEKVLQAVQEVTHASGGKVICVFGCGGDRDRGKRPLMGAVAEKEADICIITSDNPRSEIQGDIIAAIVAGMQGDTFQIIEDRAQAITHAVQRAAPADTVLVAGKGHETFQEIGGVKYPFNDAQVALQALQAWQRPQQDKRGANT